MKTLSVTGIIKEYHNFSKDFWLSYKALEKVMDKNRFDEIKMNLMRSKRIDEKYLKEIDLTQYQVEKDLIDAEWKQKSEEAKQNGTYLHEQIHNMFCTNVYEIKNTFGINVDDYRVQKTEEFLNTEKGLFPEFKMEIPLDSNHVLIGIADLIIKDGNNITIIDWKSNDKISTRAHYDFGQKKAKSLKYPLSKFEDCDLVQYQIQLSLYGWMLQKLNPEFIIQSLKIIQVKDFKTKNVYPVEYLQQDMDKLMKWHIKNLTVKEEMNKCKDS